MCNEAARRIALDQLRNDWSQLRIPLRFPEGLPNFEPTDSIRITDPAPILRASPDPAGANEPSHADRGVPATSLAAEMVTRRWSWPAPSGKPVYNYRSDGREFRNAPARPGAAPGTAAAGGQGRCLIPIDGFYEFTADGALLAEDSLPSKKPPKAKWEFRVRGLAWFCVAGLWRGGVTFKDGSVGEAWTMLTCAPGPDIAPYHDRQIVILTPPDYAAWLDGSAPAATLCRPLPAGTLAVTRVR